ncbi:ATP-dependent DNA helicase RecG [Fannyhessea vaginae]|uniref:ATP-dependent DNA helicase RecG n=1 Tax=Fannyhessea vaginae TaxID=82135 RepID=UPI00065E28F6|nr:ATP-dependent DNA helicase RecG [Fannyhessea vaginae]KMT47350.1 ATP-dependent DNA helicase RecG [Fannyhessea vaginae]
MDTQLHISEASPRLAASCALDAPLDMLPYVTPARAKLFSNLGIHTLRDLILRIPRRYLDFSRHVSILEAAVNDTVTISCVIDRINLKRPRPHLSIVEMYVTDTIGIMRISFFRQPWLAKAYHVGDVVALLGKVEYSYGFKCMNSPFIELIHAADTRPTDGYAADTHTADAHAQDKSALELLPNARFDTHILSVYALCDGLSAAWYRRIIKICLHKILPLVDCIPSVYLARNRLMGYSTAIQQIHMPTSMFAQDAARRRFAYNELFFLQLALRARTSVEDIQDPIQHCINGSHLKNFYKALPFELSAEQQSAAHDLLHDMQAKTCMNRLLLGDVGTGKTVVCALGFAVCADTSTQAAMLAPTSVLAQQYAEKIGTLLTKLSISWALLTSATTKSERADILSQLQTGSVQVIFGTTSLLSDDVQFHKLSYIVIDEQHRFGVHQRLALRQKSPFADLLAMSATPIPRTLALSFYGDLTCSFIKHKPFSTATVTTKVLANENVSVAYDAVAACIEQGQQAYIICPLIDSQDARATVDDIAPNAQSSAQTLHSAQQTFEALKRSSFSAYRIGLLTGRMDSDEKDRVMSQFRAHKLDVLVATTIVEVGVDVPRACAMIILDADRFGLATLHQLRGRVGRGSLAAQVYLVTASKKHSLARRRLDILENTFDGFELSQKDLELRREGDILGYRQSGTLTLRVCDMVRDMDLIEAAHRDVGELLDGDPDLSQVQHRALVHEMHARFPAYFEELKGIGF